MKRTMTLLAALSILFLSACGWRIQSPIAKVTPEPTPLVSVPISTPTPESPANWVPRDNVELDELFRNPEYALGHDTNIACSGSPAVNTHVNFDYTFPNWVEEMYPEGIDIFCPSYVAWQICAETSFPLACEIEVLKALNEDKPEAVATIVVEGEANATPNSEVEVEVTETISNTVVLDGLVTLINFPDEAEAVRWGPDQVWVELCGFPSLAWIACDPGVYSFDEHAPEHENDSAVWSGGAQVDNVMENSTGTWQLPGNGYMKATFGEANIMFAEYGIEFKPQEGVGYIFLARGVYAEEGGHQTPVRFEVENPDAEGAVKIMRYPIEKVDASGYFSWTHLDEDVQGQLSYDNCVYDGCNVVYIVAVDRNRGTATIVEYTAENGYVELYTNTRTK